ncbi:MAG: hypothetical protein AAF288_10730 [Planctomycetota bacterium]
MTRNATLNVRTVSRNLRRALGATAGLALFVGAGAATAQQSPFGPPQPTPSIPAPHVQNPANPGYPGYRVQPTQHISLAGQYTGDIAGTRCSLTLQQQGQQVIGAIDAAGYGYQLQFQPNGQGGFHGVLYDPQTRGQVGAELSQTPQGVTVILIAVNPHTGQQNRVPMTFQKAAPTPTPGPFPGPGVTPNTPGYPTPGVNPQTPGPGFYPGPSVTPQTPSAYPTTPSVQDSAGTQTPTWSNDSADVAIEGAEADNAVQGW